MPAGSAGIQPSTYTRPACLASGQCTRPDPALDQPTRGCDIRPARAGGCHRPWNSDCPGPTPDRDGDTQPDRNPRTSSCAHSDPGTSAGERFDQRDPPRVPAVQ